MQILLAMLNECCLLLMFNLHQLFIHSLLFVESLFGGSCRGAEVLAYPDHTSFVQKIGVKNLPERRFFCSCHTLKSHKSNASKDEAVQRCIHFFACICAFASDETLAQEFSDFLNFDSSGRWCGWHIYSVFLKRQWKSLTDGIWRLS